MNQDDIIRIADKAFATPFVEPAFRNGFFVVTIDELKRFAELVAAAAKAEEREACAKAVEAEAHMFETLAAAKSLSAAIRARGQA